ncbi:hypothetical protein NDU88_001377 [Pleurodeles waltl]|uniref:Uncharacterized protein n=1 Tax=Pleurodeles waltl TaxID=8319 RepID=A0AAV7TJI3_PLEWA|nr:hypothetical protein NDU88_001377 [Pleurodeles waltl]
MSEPVGPSITLQSRQVCGSRRLSFDPAQDASDWRCSGSAQDDKNGVHRCPDNDVATSFHVNPDVRVHAETKGEDGLEEGVTEQKDAEEPGGTESGGPEDDRRTGNTEEAADPEPKERTGETLEGRHVPGGAWLTKCDRTSSLVKREAGKKRKERHFMGQKGHNTFNVDNIRDYNKL